VQDLHFRVRGPVVEQVQRLFAADWQFCTREELTGGAWFPELAHAGDVEARVIPDGPDGDLDKLRWTLLGALSVAQRSVTVITPYFLPDTDIVTALNVASMRGVAVEILVPEENNLTLVQWASTAHLPLVVEHGCRVWSTPPPFDHSKLMLVDGQWALVGSANWDPRSLRLNFEIGLELYDLAVAARLQEIVDAKKQGAREITLDELRTRPLWQRLRDGTARLAQPYL
jgi:cardiolipin synthase